MAKSHISINAIVATLASDADLMAGFGHGDAPRRSNQRPLTPREAVCSAFSVALHRHVPEAYLARVNEVIELSDDDLEVLVDLPKVGALMMLCRKLYKESYRLGRQPTMSSLGLDDPDALNAGESLLPLLEAITATVRGQAVALKAAA